MTTLVGFFIVYCIIVLAFEEDKEYALLILCLQGVGGLMVIWLGWTPGLAIMGIISLIVATQLDEERQFLTGCMGVFVLVGAIMFALGMFEGMMSILGLCISVVFLVWLAWVIGSTLLGR